MSYLTVVHSNELVEAAYTLNVDEMRLILLAATKIDSRKSNIGEIELFPSEFVAAFDTNSKNVYRSLKQAAKGLGRKPIIIPIVGTTKVRELYWLSYNEYDNDDKGTSIKLKFNPELSPYLYDLKNNFTVIKFEQAAKLTTPFSFRLYQWLIKAKNLDSSKEGHSIQVILEIDWIKSQAGLQGKHDRWSKFSEKVIQPAVELINSKTDISIIWKPIKQGRKVHAIQFNYVVEEAAFAKPIRPRLYRRPKVVKGSHEEGSWMRKNLSLLLSYRTELKNYDSSAKLDIKDLERIAEYSSICDRVIHQNALKELAERRSKKTKTV